VKASWLLAAILLVSCSRGPLRPATGPGEVIAHVHWGPQDLAGKRVLLMQTGDTLRTDSYGKARFVVPPGTYVLRAFEINRGGPGLPWVDFKVKVRSGEEKLVDIVDCLPCL
jgi:hypothetical protein